MPLFGSGVTQDEVTELEHENKQLRQEAAALHAWIRTVEAERDSYKLKWEDASAHEVILEAELATRWPLATLKLTGSVDADALDV